MKNKTSKNEDHSLKGYFMRQPTEYVKGEMARVLLLESRGLLSEYYQFHKDTLTEVLQLYGENTDIEVSSATYPFLSEPLLNILTDK